MGSEPDRQRSAASPTLVLAAAGVVLVTAGCVVFLLRVQRAQRRAEARIDQLEKQVTETHDQTRATGKAVIDLWRRLDAATAAEGVAEMSVTPVPELDPDRVDGVVILSDAEQRVYVVSLGSVHGIKPAQRVQILRGGEYVTDIVIDSVQPTAAAGTPAKDRPQREIRKGDQAVPVK